MPSSSGAKRRWLSDYKSSGRHDCRRPDFSLRISCQIQPVGIVDNAIEDTIPNGGVGETSKPVRHRYLRSDQGGGVPIAVIKDFEQVLGIRRGDGVAHPVIEDEQVEFGQADR